MTQFRRLFAALYFLLIAVPAFSGGGVVPSAEPAAAADSVGQQLGEVVVVGSSGRKLADSPFNTAAVDTRALQNSGRTIADALAKAPGLKIRESGGLGADMAVNLDGFSGKHVKVFIDGVPQEGVGKSFGLNNIPAGFAERVEVYRGVVPVGFGADAIGGVVNIVTSRSRRKWYVDASYSYGSFGTRKAYIDLGRTLPSGLTFKLNAFRNYSDNNYWVDAPVEDFATGAINRKKPERVRRFHDAYHNEAVVARVGVVRKSWADRLLLGLTYSHEYKELQTGVRQEIVYGQKHRHGHSLIPSLVYAKRDLLLRGLDVAANVSYMRNVAVNVDTASVKYNWRGETAPLNSPGEQAYIHSRADNDNWTAAISATYRFAELHTIVVSDVFNAFARSNTSLLAAEESADEFSKATRKNVAGISYRFLPSRQWNLTAFAKHYNQHVAGPVALTSAADSYVRKSRSVSSAGYGLAAGWSMPGGLAVKLSFEKAFRLPTVEEMFGDEDLEQGDIALKPESSYNLNLNLTYSASFGRSDISADAALIFRDTRDYIQRNLLSLGGGKTAATYVNYGRVATRGFSLSASYSYAGFLVAGCNFSQMDVRDNMKTAMNSSAANLSYRSRMPNLPYLFAGADISLFWRGAGRKSNVLSLTYDNNFTHSFCYYSQNIGDDASDYMVPDQFAHNVSIAYSIGSGKFNFSLECRNLTDAKLYDNFSLQKPGRAFFAKVRVCFGN